MCVVVVGLLCGCSCCFVCKCVCVCSLIGYVVCDVGVCVSFVFVVCVFSLVFWLLVFCMFLL